MSEVKYKRGRRAKEEGNPNSYINSLVFYTNIHLFFIFELNFFVLTFVIFIPNSSPIDRNLIFNIQFFVLLPITRSLAIHKQIYMILKYNLIFKLLIVEHFTPTSVYIWE